MNATISLKQLRTDPRKFIRLLISGHSVDITEHRKVLISAKADKQPSESNYDAILAAIEALPPIHDPAPEVDTPTRMKQIKDEHFAHKYGTR